MTCRFTLRATDPALPWRAFFDLAAGFHTAVHASWAGAGMDRIGFRATASKADQAPAEDPPAASFRELVLPHLDAAYNLARYLTRDADAADDIVQDAFLRAFRAFAGYRGGDARVWLMAIVRNCARSWANARARERARSEPLGGSKPADGASEDDPEERQIWDPDEATPETAILRDSEAAFLRRLIETLPADFREVLVLREFDELSYRQIAEITAMPIGTVMSRLARARTMLAAAWKRLRGDDRP